MHREDAGAIELWRIKDDLQKYFLHCHHWSDDRWKKAWQEKEETKKYQYCSDSSGVILYLRGLQRHSGRNLIDFTLQDNVVFPSNFFQYSYHVGCAIKLLSIINSGLIPGGQHLSNRQTVIFLLVDSMDKNRKVTINLSVTRLAQTVYKAWKKHQQQCGSRAVSVQVNVVSVSDYAFHKFPFDLLIQVSAIQLSLFLCISFVMMATDRVKMLCTLSCNAPEILRMKSSMLFSQNLYSSKRRSLKFLFSTVWIHISRKHLGILRQDLQRRNRISAHSLHVCASRDSCSLSIKCIWFGEIPDFTRTS